MTFLRLTLNREKLPKYMQEKMSLSEEIEENDATRKLVKKF